MLTTRNRQVRAGQPVIDQVDIVQLSDTYTRVLNLTYTNVTAQLFFNNVVQSWALVTGTGIADLQLSSGSVYFHEVTAGTGIYSVRFRPNSVGFWRLLLNYPTATQIVALGFDVIEAETLSSGLQASFFKGV